MTPKIIRHRRRPARVEADEISLDHVAARAGVFNQHAVTKFPEMTLRAAGHGAAERIVGGAGGAEPCQNNLRPPSPRSSRGRCSFPGPDCRSCRGRHDHSVVEIAVISGNDVARTGCGATDQVWSLIRCQSSRRRRCFGSAFIPVASVPIKFPCTVLLTTVEPRIRMPLPRFPEMTLPAPAFVPPMRLWLAPKARTRRQGCWTPRDCRWHPCRCNCRGRHCGRVRGYDETVLRIA